MNKLAQFWLWLRGKKTYVVCVVSMLGVWYNVYLGTMTVHDAWQATETAIIGLTLRHAISAPDSPTASSK